VGVGRLLRYDPRWTDGFEATTSGFLRSFVAPLLGLPFSLIVAALVSAAAEDQTGADMGLVWGQAVSHLVYAALYPVAIGLLARPAGIGAGYALFVIVTNWASLFLNIALAGVSAATLFGENGFVVFNLMALVILGASIFITWRAAREVLSDQLSPALMVVVVSIGVLALADYVGLSVVARLT